MRKYLGRAYAVQIGVIAIALAAPALAHAADEQRQHRRPQRHSGNPATSDTRPRRGRTATRISSSPHADPRLDAGRRDASHTTAEAAAERGATTE